MKPLKKRNIYESTHKEVMDWVKEMKRLNKFYFRKDTETDSFCSYLERYIEAMQEQRR